MKTINEWLKTKGMEELSSDFGMTSEYNEEVVTSQVDQLVSKLEGILHNLTEEQKSATIDKFMKEVESRILRS